MAEVKVLLEGFTNTDKRAAGEDEITRCTTTLIFDEDKIILSDPGVLDDQKIMVDALAQENLTVDDITHIFITHSHMDHYRNIGMFPKAISIDYTGIWQGGKFIEREEQLSKDIRLIETPGHSYDSLTALVQTEKGIIAIAGDLWWSSRGPKFDKFATDMEKLKESREKVLSLADYIIPGHGKMFEAKNYKLI
jgi:glyoxylase-like metal-dependent hydrolase (beta-lactamase superfamily II)